MTCAFVPSAFVSAPVVANRAASVATATIATVAASSSSSSIASSTALQAASSAVVLKDCTSGALAFFNGIRTPAALIAGSSLAALFSMIGKYRELQKSRGERVTLRIFHACALFGFLLAVTTVVSSTSAGTRLLLGEFNPMAPNVYQFLKREMEFEWTLTRWCFLTGVMNFLTAIGGRILIEFDLLTEYRAAERYIVFLALGGMIGHLTSLVNSSLNCWPNLWSMTVDVYRMATLRAWRNKYPLAIVSLLGVTTAISWSAISIVQEIFGWNKAASISDDESDSATTLDYMPSILAASSSSSGEVSDANGDTSDGAAEAHAEVSADNSAT